MKYLLFLLCLGTFALAEHIGAEGRVGSAADIRIEENGTGQSALIEVRTDAALTKNSEMMFYIFPPEGRGNASMIRRLVPPSERGLYRLELSFPQAGEWGINARYGVGLDVYYVYVPHTITLTEVKTSSYQKTFMGDLRSDVPDYVQPLGFGVFGLIALMALMLVISVLYWLKKQQAALKIQA